MVILRLAAGPFNPTPVSPQGCRWCGSGALVRCGRRRRLLKDRVHSQAVVQRYRCKSCRRTFTAHPEGLDCSPQSRAYQATLLALYLLGLSLRGVPLVLALLKLPRVSFVTVWRDVQRWGQQLRRPRLLAVDLGGRMLLVQAVGTPQSYRKAFTTLRHLGVQIVVSDDGHAFTGPIEEMGLRRQGCLFHAHRALGRALAKLSAQEREQWREPVELLQQSLRGLPPQPPPELFRLQALPLPGPLRGAVVYLLDLWHRLTLYQRLPGLPRTNNVTERAIGRSKLRARTIRGFKSLPGALNFFATTQALLAPP